MSYFLRLFSKDNEDIPISQLKKSLASANIQTKIRIKERTKNLWNQIEVALLDGDTICRIERLAVLADTAGEAQIFNFLNEIEDSKPQSAVKWLKKYLSEVKVIYTFEVLDSAEKNNGWDAIETIQDKIWETIGGILQADHEGFTNDQGYHILWQFDEDAEGKWMMAVLNLFGNWISFEMDLENQKHREAFWAGKVPKGVRKIE
ncbi:MAG: hypothetical protein KAX49_03305 [Halanaerobiales bacterium]|nr:hypothetical protein [Halanaerobiales bacterium]